MYNKKLVASVKAGGKIMREDGETVYLPFGSEYSLLLKNLNNRKALVKIELDGEQVVQGGLIVNPNETLDLERFMVNNMNEGPKFKFIEKTEQISDHRGDKIEDGIIRVSYQFEAEYAFAPYSFNYQPWDSGQTNQPPITYGGTTTSAKTVLRNSNSRLYSGNINSFLSNTQVGSTIDGSSEVHDSAPVEQEVYTSANIQGVMNVQANDAGITVHGDKSTQSFSYGHIGMLELDTHVICLNLRGAIGQRPIRKPVTVKRKIKCANCGNANPTSNKCCGGCGTNLTYQY